MVSRKEHRISKPKPADLKRFAEILHRTEDPVLAYLAMRPNGRRDVAERQGPKIAALPDVELLLADLRKGPEAPEGLSDDARMMHHALALADNRDLSPQERLKAMTVYKSLKRSLEADRERSGEFGAELAAFLREEGIPVTLPGTV